MKNERVATGLAGFVGTLGMFALGYALAAAVKAAASGRGPERTGASA